MDDGRAVREVWSQSSHRLQMGTALPRRRGSGPARAQPRAAELSAPHARTPGGADPRSASGVRLGSEEAAPGAGEASPGAQVARAEHDQRDSRAPWTAAEEETPSSVESSGCCAPRHRRPNQVWPADFKGQFKTRDGRYCFPLTVTDHFSRSLLLCKGLPSVKTEGAKPAFRRLFGEVGLPEAIRTDNGAPFASRGLHGLSELNVWWIKLESFTNASSRRARRKTERTSGCIASSSARRQLRRPQASGPDRAGSIASASATTKSALMRASRIRSLHRVGKRRHGRTRNMGKKTPGRPHDPGRQGPQPVSCKQRLS